MAIEGLSFYMDRDYVKESVNEAVETLRKAQKDDGSFGNCESTAETICALSQLEIDVLSDKRFVVNGKNPGDGLMRYKIEDGGFCHETDAEFSNDMASEKALMALNAMRLCKDGKKLYTSAF